MRRILQGVLACVCVGALGVAALPAASMGSEDTDRAAYAQPASGSWKHKDAFGDADGTLKVKPAKKGKPPKIAKLTFKVLQQDNGYQCPGPGAVLKVKGSKKLRKAPKWAGGSDRSPWITGKNKKYDDDFPNMLGMKPVKVKVKVGAETRRGLLAVSFVQDRPRRPHELEISMRLLPPGATDTSEGWCLFEASGKPGK